MSFNVTVGLNEETLSALKGLTAAIAGISGAAPAAKPAADTAATKPAAKPKSEAPAKEEAAEPVTIYWFSSASNTVGVVESEDEFKALKKADAKTVKITKDKYETKLAEIEAAAAEDDATEDDDAPVPTEQDIIKAFGAYLPATLSDAEKKKRRPFVKAILDRFGAPKATELAEEHRRLAINLVERKMAGEDVDPENDDFQEVASDDDDGLV